MPLAAKAAGSDAMRDALHLTASGFALDRALRGFVPNRADRGIETLEHLQDVAQLSDADITTRDQRLEHELLRTDLLHPPTAYRIAFLETLGPLPGAMTPDAAVSARLAAEWAPHLDKIGREVLARRRVEVV